MTTRFLLCEGPCNPGLGRVEPEIEDYRRQEARCRRDGDLALPPLKDRLILQGLHTL